MTGVFYPEKDGWPKLSDGEVKSYRQLLGFMKTTPEQKAKAKKALESRDVREWDAIWTEICRSQPNED